MTNTSLNQALVNDYTMQRLRDKRGKANTDLAQHFLSYRSDRKSSQEFFAPVYLPLLSDNHRRFIQDCKPKTIHDYLLRFYRSIGISDFYQYHQAKIANEKALIAPNIRATSPKRQKKAKQVGRPKATEPDLVTQMVKQLGLDKDPQYQQRQQAVQDRFQHELIKKFDMVNAIDRAIIDIEKKRTQGKLKSASYRQYKACFCGGLSVLYAITNNPLAVTKDHRQFLWQFDVPSDDVLQNLYERVLMWEQGDKDTSRELDEQAQQLNQTSTGKAKNFHQVFYERVLDYHVHHPNYKSPNLPLLQHFVYLNCVFGLRPSEWLHASVVKRDVITQDMAQLDPKIAKTLDEPLFQSMLQKKELRSYFNDKHEQADEHGKAYWLKVKNAKNTMGRACGAHRYLAIPYDEKLHKALAWFMNELTTYKDSILKQDNGEDVHSHYEQDILFHDNFTKPLSNLLAYILRNDKVCQSHARRMLKERQYQYKHYHSQKAKKAKEKQGGGASLPDSTNTTADNSSDNSSMAVISVPRLPPVLEYPTLYSTRHQAVANAKANGLDEISIASLFGHISTTTARLHYGKAIHGSGKIQPLPHHINLAVVVANLPQQQLVKLIEKHQLTQHYSPKAPTQQVQASTPTLKK